MDGYWWACDNLRCENHDTKLRFKDTLGKGIGVFLWDELEPRWDQQLLLKECPRCKRHSLRITYDFERGDRERIRVAHIVGLRQNNSPFLQMMWEGIPDSGSGQHWFDFKYTNGRNALGLNKPCIFERRELNEIFAVYCKIVGEESFP